MRIWTSFPIAALALTACQMAPDQNASEGPALTNISNYTAEVAALPTRQRDAVFLRAIRDAGLGCQDVTKSMQVGDTAGQPLWRAECDGGTAHLIQVSPNGTAVITSRTGP
jgi:hypothetical protein